jgi:hypothetical protein
LVLCLLGWWFWREVSFVLKSAAEFLIIF